MKSIGLDVIRVTEGAAIAAFDYVGSGKKELADKAATDAMIDRLNTLDIQGKIIASEYEKDKSFGIPLNGLVGCGTVNHYDICVDPIEGTRPTVNSGPEAISVIGFAEKDTLKQIDDFYAMKLAYGPWLNDTNINLSLDMPIKDIVTLAAYALNKPRDRVVVCMLDRPRHSDMIRELRDLGVRIKLIQDCDVSGAVATCLPDSGVDLLLGIGGAPEAVIAACAIKCLGGGIQVTPVKMAKDNARYAIEDDTIWDAHDLVKGECVFAATGITNGSMLKGVRTNDQGRYVTHSVFMRSESRTIRWLKTEHGN